jgi:hypothetical protein
VYILLTLKELLALLDEDDKKYGTELPEFMKFIFVEIEPNRHCNSCKSGGVAHDKQTI